MKNSMGWLKKWTVVVVLAAAILGLAGTVGATVPSETNKIVYAGTGSATVFPYPFKIFSSSDLEVVRTEGGVDTKLVLNVHYTVSGVGVVTGGNVTLVTAPTAAQTLTIFRTPAFLQNQQYLEGGKFPAKSHENSLDKLLMQLQALKSRALLMPTGNSHLDQIVPAPAPTTGGLYLRWNAAGTALEAVPVAPALVAGFDLEMVDVRDYGDGTISQATLNAAVAAIGSESRRLYLTRGTWPITSDLVIPANITLVPEKGSILQPATGVTLTINGPLEAGPVQVFAWAGTGSIKFGKNTREVLAEWFYVASEIDHTAAIGKAVAAAFTGTTDERVPVILTAKDYVIADLAFDGVTDSINYSGLTIIGRAGGHNASPTLTVTAGHNGIFISGKDAIGSANAQHVTLKNLYIKKAAYPGDASGDYGLRFRSTTYVTLDNLKFENFGGACLRWAIDYYSTDLRNINFRTSYRGIEWDPVQYAQYGASYYGCTFYGVKTWLYNNESSWVRANFVGGQGDDAPGFASTTYIHATRTTELNFTGLQFEGVGGTNYAITLAPWAGGTDSPADRLLNFKDCQITFNASAYFVGFTGDATASISLNNTNLIYGGAPHVFINQVLTPNYTDSASSVSMLSANSTPDADGPRLYMGTPLTAWGQAMDARTIAFYTGITKDSWGARMCHRIMDGTHLNFDKKADIWRSEVTKGLWTPTLNLEQSSSGYGTDIKINTSAIIPAATTCNGTAGDHYVSSVAAPTQFSQSDKVQINGAGAAGANLTAYIVYIESDGSKIYINTPIVTTVTGAAFAIDAAVGQRKLNTAPAEAGAGGSKYVITGWICTVAGQPGTWLQMRTLTGN